MIKRLFSTTTKFVKKTKVKKEKSLTIFNKPVNDISIIPPTSRHQTYSNYLSSKNIEMVFAIGPAGTGKTYLACQEAVKQLKNKQVEKIVITRPMVCNDEELGFLPGSIESKMDPWIRPIVDIFQEHYKLSQIQNMMANRQIECSPLAYMRGRTFNNAFIIGDEMQNSTDNQMKMLLTRIGKKSKMVITGDIEQIDNSLEENGSGLFLFYERLSDKFENNLFDNNPDFENTNIFQKIKWIEFQQEDIQRNPIIGEILNLYKEPFENKEIFFNIQEV